MSLILFSIFYPDEKKTSKQHKIHRHHWCYLVENHQFSVLDIETAQSERTRWSILPYNVLHPLDLKKADHICEMFLIPASLLSIQWHKWLLLPRFSLLATLQVLWHWRKGGWWFRRTCMMTYSSLQWQVQSFHVAHGWCEAKSHTERKLCSFRLMQWFIDLKPLLFFLNRVWNTTLYLRGRVCSSFSPFISLSFYLSSSCSDGEFLTICTS